VDPEPDLRVVLAPNPGFMTGPGTNQYLIGAPDDAVQIDVAALDEENERRLAASGVRPRRLLLTHIHPDHVGGAQELRELAGLPIAVHRRRADITFGGAPLAPDILLEDGAEIVHAAGRLRAVHTPGHESGHCCYYDPDRRWLFTGDMILGTGTVVVAPPDGDMVAYLASLRRLATLDLACLLPGHGSPIERPYEKIEEYLTHRLMREAQILDALAAGVRDVPAIVARLYADVPVVLHGAAAATVRAHLGKLIAEGRAVAEPDDRFSPS
jgi:glyoxylase-like metal-dependent hydrolase (beta-lactamase superfamily II)